MSARKISQRIKDNPHPIDTTGLPLLLDETQASKVLGVSLSYLRKSRSEGTQKTAPRHLNMCALTGVVCIPSGPVLLGSMSLWIGVWRDACPEHKTGAIRK